MKISTILDHIDSGHLALPEFQRGFVWNGEQVRGLFESLYRGYPVGGLLVWATGPDGAGHRGSGPLAAGGVKLLLDGQQRITSLYGVHRGKPPAFFDGNSKAFTDLYFSVEDETFEFYQPIKMKDDPLWVGVSELMSKGMGGLGDYITRLTADPALSPKAGEYAGRLTRLLGVTETDLHIDEVSGSDKSLDVVVDIFNRVNSGGTKLSKGDLALARICVDWPEARDAMRTQLKVWEKAGYNFQLDWLLRSVNTVLTGRAQFSYLQDKNAEDVRGGLTRAIKAIDHILNMIGGQLGLDHDRVLFGRYAIPVMARYLDRQDGPPPQHEGDKLLFWYLQAGMWGRFSGSTETVIDQDLAAIEQPEGGLDRLLERLRLWHGQLQVEPANFLGWSRGARFYPVLYMLTRMGGARDWWYGSPQLKKGLLGKMAALEVHHIFPKSRLYSRGYQRPEVNALANFCFLTKETNLFIDNRLPEKYFPVVEEAYPGALASQWIPMDPELWEVENYPKFLEARQALMAEEARRRLEALLHGDTRWLQGTSTSGSQPARTAPDEVPGGIASDQEEQELEDVNEWVAEQGLPRGTLSHDFADTETGEQRAVFDLAWPDGIQQGLSQPVAILLNEDAGTVALASDAGYRCFTTIGEFRRYVEREMLSAGSQPAVSR